MVVVVGRAPSVLARPGTGMDRVILLLLLLDIGFSLFVC
jgi:hypothetical protein